MQTLTKTSVVGNTKRPIDLLLELIKNTTASNSEARQANESRYNDILELYGMTRKRVLDQLANYGQSRQEDLKHDYTNLSNDIKTQFGERGMPGSTAAAVSKGVATHNYERNLSSLLDDLRQNYANADTSFSDKAAGVMERREDPYPDQSQSQNLTGLLSALASSGALGALGGGGGGGGLFGGGHSQLPGRGRNALLPVYTPGIPRERTQSDVNAYNNDLRYSKLALKMAMDRANGPMGTAQDQINLAMNDAIGRGLADWGPGQPVPVVPGAPPSLLDAQTQQTQVDPRVLEMLWNRLNGQQQAPQIIAQPAAPAARTWGQTPRVGASQPSPAMSPPPASLQQSVAPMTGRAWPSVQSNAQGDNLVKYWQANQAKLSPYAAAAGNLLRGLFGG